MITLYLAIHNKTGKKYFGKSERFHTSEDLQKYYHGSGIYWLKHLKVHGDDVKMTALFTSSNEKLVELIALTYSKVFNIVDTDEYANLVEETGHGGNPKGFTFPEEAKLKVSEAVKEWHKTHDNPFKGRKHSLDTLEHLSKMSRERIQRNGHPMKGRKHSDEAKKKMSDNHADFKGNKNPTFGKVTVRDLNTGEYYLVTKEFFQANKYDPETETGYLVGNRSIIKNYKRK